MTDDYSGVALWDEDADLDLEDTLPMPDELRSRIKTWLADWEQIMVTDPGVDASVEHDRRGYQLSLDVQAVLGPAYRIQYHFNTDQVRREVRKFRERDR